MERLTAQRVNGIKSGYWSLAKKDEPVQRLGKYEDTGMEPEELRKAGKWNPVEEQLPEVGEYVIGTNKYDEVLVYRYGWNSPHTKKMFFSLCGAAVDITAWMPLPKPYRPE